MSQIMQLKQQVTALGSDAGSTATALAGFKTKFANSVAQVSALIGGTSSSTDQDLIATIQAAEAKVDEAVGALQLATKKAHDYAQAL